MPSKFVRARRNVLVASLVLLAFLSTGAEISRLNVFGNDIELRRPLLVSWPLWIAWGYLLWRFYQHVHDLGNLGIYNAFYNRLLSLAGAAARQYVRASFHPGPPYSTDVKRTFAHGTVDYPTFLPDGWSLRVKMPVTYSETLRTGEQEIDQVVHIPRRQIGWLRFRAGWWTFAHTRLITEYVLPFVVAASPPLLWLAHTWLGVTLVP